MSIVIATPTGNIGSRLVSNLLKAGADLALIARSPDRLPEDVRRRVAVKQGTLQDSEFVARATEGADALFWLTPTDPTKPGLKAWYDQMAASVSGAVKSNGIRYVVNLSSGGVTLPDAGPVSGLAVVEGRLNETDANVLHLRPGMFFENILMQIETLRSMSTLFGLIGPDVLLPQLATRDIADAAAPPLLRRDWTGKQVRGLHGPTDLSSNDVASILSDVLGRQVRYVQVAPEQMKTGLLSTGMCEEWADALIDMYEAFIKAGKVPEPRTPETTTPTTLQEWATDVLKPMLAA
jgi:uncharacterized protein YbjT (DUF2867 family)